MSFENMKKRNTTDLISRLSASEEKKSYKDDRFWKPSLDDAGTGSAIIRFLPEPPKEEMPYVLYFSHGFQGPGGWYIENSRTTLGEKDPVSEMNTKLWNSGQQSNKDLVSQKFKRKKNYVSNILVVSDPGNPENEGKVFLYRYGQKIFDKIQEAMKPQFADEEAIIPFDFWKGANFRLRIRKVAGFLNYDKSEFDSVSTLFDGDDEKLKAVWEGQNSLQEFVTSDAFKSYDELKERLERVLGTSGPVTSRAEEMESPEREDVNSRFGSDSTPTEETSSDAPSEEEDAMSYFSKLAGEG